MNKVKDTHNHDKYVLDASEIIECINAIYVMKYDDQKEQAKAVAKAEKQVLTEILNQLIHKGIITRRELKEDQGSTFEYKILAIKQFV